MNVLTWKKDYGSNTLRSSWVIAFAFKGHVLLNLKPDRHGRDVKRIKLVSQKLDISKGFLIVLLSTKSWLRFGVWRFGLEVCFLTWYCNLLDLETLMTFALLAWCVCSSSCLNTIKIYTEHLIPISDLHEILVLAMTPPSSAGNTHSLVPHSSHCPSITLAG